MMKKFFCVTAFMLAVAVNAQDVKLPAPSEKGGSTLVEALWNRMSVREFSGNPLSAQDLSDLLWAAAGVNRPESGKRTNPTAMNLQEISVYVFNSDGVYMYEHDKHSLKRVVDRDNRSLMAKGQSFVNDAPVVLLIVADMGKYKRDDDHARMMAAVDAGIVSQNINLFCAAKGLCTVPRGTMDNEAIIKLLGLSERQIPVLNNPVGYKK